MDELIKESNDLMEATNKYEKEQKYVDTMEELFNIVVSKHEIDMKLVILSPNTDQNTIVSLLKERILLSMKENEILSNMRKSILS